MSKFKVGQNVRAISYGHDSYGHILDVDESSYVVELYESETAIAVTVGELEAV